MSTNCHPSLGNGKSLQPFRTRNAILPAPKRLTERVSLISIRSALPTPKHGTDKPGINNCSYISFSLPVLFNDMSIMRFFSPDDVFARYPYRFAYNHSRSSRGCFASLVRQYHRSVVLHFVIIYMMNKDTVRPVFDDLFSNS